MLTKNYLENRIFAFLLFAQATTSDKKKCTVKYAACTNFTIFRRTHIKHMIYVIYNKEMSIFSQTNIITEADSVPILFQSLKYN